MVPVSCKPLILQLGLWVAMLISCGASALGLGIDRQHFIDDTGTTVILRGYYQQVLVGEFGANLKGNNNQLFQFQMDTILHFFDLHLISSARWNYSPQWTPASKDHFHDEDFSCFDDQRQIRLSCAPRAHIQRLTGKLVHSNIHHRGEAKLFIPLLPRLSDVYQYPDTQIDVAWDHQPAQGTTRIFAGKSVLFEDREVAIATEGSDLTCEFDEDQRFVECVSAIPGIKQVRIYEP